MSIIDFDSSYIKDKRGKVYSVRRIISTSQDGCKITAELDNSEIKVIEVC